MLHSRHQLAWSNLSTWSAEISTSTRACVRNAEDSDEELAALPGRRPVAATPSVTNLPVATAAGGCRQAIAAA